MPVLCIAMETEEYKILCCRPILMCSVSLVATLICSLVNQTAPYAAFSTFRIKVLNAEEVTVWLARVTLMGFRIGHMQTMRKLILSQINVVFCSVAILLGDYTVPVADCRLEQFSSHPKSEMKMADFLNYWQSLARPQGEADCTKKLLYLKDWHLARYYHVGSKYIIAEIMLSCNR